MRNFTQRNKLIYYSFSLVLCLVLGLSQLSAQSHFLNIDSPSSVAGEYIVQVAGFGPQLCASDGISGEFILVDDGNGVTTACDTNQVNDLSGKIAIIDRGACDFSAKVYNAQVRGAIAVLVCDVQMTDELIFMGSGTNADLITIPSYSILRSDCDLIKTGFIDGTVTGSFNLPPVEDDFEGEVIFTETFANGFDGWTTSVEFCSGTAGTEGVELWRYKPDAVAIDPCGGAFIPSPTRCDGAAAFESGFRDSGLETGCADIVVGAGPCPTPHTGALTSPMIDLTTSNAAGYSVRFYQVARRFRADYFVGWSYDGGVTWDSTLVNEDLAGPEEQSPALDGVVSLPLPGSIDAASVMLRFRMTGDYYYWIIDDVQIIAQEANNLQVNGNFYAIPPNRATPASQVEPFGFLADIENVGSASQANTNLNITIVDSTITNIVYTADLDYGSVPPNTLVENIPFAEQFTPTDVGPYIGVYEISSDNMDVDDSNNIQGFIYDVTENLFTKEVGANIPVAPGTGNWDEGELRSWAYGNYFYVPNGDGFFVDDVTFSLGNPSELAGKGIIITLYEWTGDTNNDGNMDPGERENVAFGFYPILGTEQALAPITIPFPGEGLDPVPLKDDTEYVLMLEYVADDATTSVFFGCSDELDYAASIFVSAQQGAPRYAALIGINGDLGTEPYSTVGFTGQLFSIVPALRMSITSTPTNTKDLPSITDEFTIFPNPVEDHVNLQLAFQERATQMTVRVMDISGKTILQRDYENVQREFFDYDVSNLTAGTYLLQVTTNAGTGTRKFIKSE
ncbi:MAG: T9SS type A sorting domain-containing protein [Bacteroidota bacterium]